MNTVMTRHLLRALIAALITTFAFGAQAAEFSVDQLMQALAKHKSGRATFTEKKFVAAFDQPIESSGELSYSAPNRLEKKTLKPRLETMVLEGEVVTIERKKQKYVFNLQEYPDIVGMVDGIRATLIGDRKVLERNFKLKLNGDSSRWILSLTPTDQKVARAVQQIQISGGGDDIRAVDVYQADGDRSMMTIERASAKPDAK